MAIGLCIGLGGAIFGDILGLCLLFSNRIAPLTAVLRPVHSFVLAGLTVLWLSGAAIALIKFNLSALPVKVAVKLGLASVLLVNAYFIGKHLLPLALKKRTPLIRHLGWPDQIKLILVSSVSVACWLSALLIVKFSPLQQMPIVALAGMVMLFWVLCALGLFAVVAGGRFFFARFRDAPRAGHIEEEPRYPIPANDEPGLSSKMHTAGAVVESFNERMERIFSPLVEKAERVSSAPPPGVKFRDSDGISSSSTRRLLDVCGWFAETVSVWCGRTFGRLDFAAKFAAPTSVQDKNTAEGSSATPPTFPSIFAMCRTALIGTAGISAITNILMLTGPLFMLQIYDRVLTSKSVPTLAALILLVALLFCFMGALELIRSRVLVRIGLRIDQSLSKVVFERVVAIGPAIGNLKTRILQDLGHLRHFISGGGPAALFDVPWVPFYFLLIFMFHWALGLVAVLGALVLAGLSVVNEFASRTPVAAASQHSGRALALAESGWRNAEPLHAMGMFERYRDKWLSEHQKGLLVNVQASDLAGTLSVLSKVSRLFLQSSPSAQWNMKISRK